MMWCPQRSLECGAGTLPTLNWLEDAAPQSPGEGSWPNNQTTEMILLWSTRTPLLFRANLKDPPPSHLPGGKEVLARRPGHVLGPSREQPCPEFLVSAGSGKRARPEPWEEGLPATLFWGFHEAAGHVGVAPGQAWGEDQCPARAVWTLLRRCLSSLSVSFSIIMNSGTLRPKPAALGGGGQLPGPGWRPPARPFFVPLGTGRLSDLETHSQVL